MRSTLLALTILAVATVGIGIALRQTPYFPGDVEATRWIQSLAGAPGWAVAVSALATSPYKYFVMGLAIGLSFSLGGWRGAVLAALAIGIEQNGAESTKAFFMRPRPSPQLVSVVGSPSGFSFPSTTLTFFAATFGVMAVLSARTKTSNLRWPLFVVTVALLIAGAVARVALGAHWPSDVVLTLALSVGWIWAFSKIIV